MSQHIANLASRLPDVAERLANLPVRPEPKSGLYIFVSYDLVNSTAYKAVSSDWPIVITEFYDIASERISKYLAGAFLWKLVGDEVLFAKRVLRREELQRLPKATHECMMEIRESLFRKFPSSSDTLGIKGVLWMAHVDVVDAKDLNDPVKREQAVHHENIAAVVSASGGNESIDFLGPDVDAGFRISKFSAKDRLVISANLTLALYQLRAKVPKIEEQLRIVDFQALRGVWKGRHYPIVWFEDDWSRFDESFPYDERLRSDYSGQILTRLDKKLIEKLPSIARVFDDLKLTDSITEQLDALDVGPKRGETSPVFLAPSLLTEVHCVAVCINPSREVLIAQRSAAKRRFAGLWEFGCGQIKTNESFAACLMREYKNDFNIEIDLLNDGVPIGVFEIKDTDAPRLIPGLIFAAMTSSTERTPHWNRKAHQTSKWVSLDEAEGFQPAECIPNFHDTVRKAISCDKR